MFDIRTDLAMEAHELWQQRQGDPGDLRGVVTSKRQMFGYEVNTVSIQSESGSRALGKPQGNYTTISLAGLREREPEAFSRGCSAVAEILQNMLKVGEGDTVLVAGLGNLSVTPDAIGPNTVSNLMVTRHLKFAAPETFRSFRPVAAIAPGVLAETGVESSEIIRSLVRRISPAAVIVADALASRSMSRVCRTVQIADSGIVPGSGVGNARAAIDKETLGVPVIAIGVPTVVDAATLAVDMAAESGYHNIEESELRKAGTNMIVTPRDIDSDAKDLGKLLGYGINLALHPGITLEDITTFLS